LQAAAIETILWAYCKCFKLNGKYFTSYPASQIVYPFDNWKESL